MPQENAARAAWLEDVAFNDAGLVPAIAQEAATGRVLTLAWMDRAALAATAADGLATYWSRSRRRLWRKGETSGHQQKVLEIRLDCDADAVLLTVEQTGVACHTGRESCFYRRLAQGARETARETTWETADPVRIDPEKIYG